MMIEIINLYCTIKDIDLDILREADNPHSSINIFCLYCNIPISHSMLVRASHSFYVAIINAIFLV